LQIFPTISESLASISASLENLTGIKPTPTPTFTPVTIPIGYRLTETTITLVKGGFLEKYGIIPTLVPYASGVEMRDGVIVGDIAFGERARYLRTNNICLHRKEDSREMGNDERSIKLKAVGVKKFFMINFLNVMLLRLEILI